MYCLDGLAEAQTWQLLDQHLATATRPHIPARADFVVRSIREVGLAVDPNWDPPRHVSIVGWPDTEDAQATRVHQLVDISNGCERSSQ